MGQRGPICACLLTFSRMILLGLCARVHPIVCPESYIRCAQCNACYTWTLTSLPLQSPLCHSHLGHLLCALVRAACAASVMDECVLLWRVSSAVSYV